jgi:hypothetical protein
MEKILVSTKHNHNGGSDAVGSSLPQLLNADYLQQNMNCQVYLSDPFYNAHNILNKFCHVITDEINNDFDYFDRILQPKFCFGDLYDFKNKKKIKVEGREFLNKHFEYKKSEYQIYQNKSFKTINAMNKANYFKSLDIPYDMYYSLFEREKFIPSFFLKKDKELPINKNKDVFSIQIRRSTHKKNFDTVAPELYDHFIVNLVNKIKKEANNPNIIFYGIDKERADKESLIKKLLDLKCIHLENYLSNPLERALILAKYTNYIFSQFNGFTQFTSYIGDSKNVLKKKFFINSESNLKDLHTRRILKDGYLGDTYSINSNFYNPEFYPVDSVLGADLNIFKKDKIIKVKTKPKKKRKKIPLLIYDTSDLSKHYFSKEIDAIIFKKLIKDLKILHKNHKIIKVKKKVNLKIKKSIQNNLNLSTHYSLKKNYKKNERIGLGSFDFLSHPLIERLKKKKLISASNILYEDLYSYFVRKVIKPKIVNKSKILSKKILIIEDPNLINKEKKNDKFIKIKRYFKHQEKENDSEDWYKFKGFVNKTFFCSSNFLYIRKNKLIYQNNKKNYYEINEKNIQIILKKYNNILCRPNHLSLLIKFLFPSKNIIFYSRKDFDKKIFLDTEILFYHNNEMVYGDFFKEKFVDLKEVFLYFFKKFKILNT